MQNNEITDVQSRVIDAVILCKGSRKEASKILGQSQQYIGQVITKPKVKDMYEHREQMALKFVNGQMAEPVVTKAEVARMFLDIANAGTERGFDREGNSMMINPGSANTALSNINKMYGYEAPTETVVTKVERTELEIVASVQSLQAELGELLALEADTIDEDSDSQRSPDPS